MASDDRVRVTYRIAAADVGEARARALGIALEQTVEVPGDVVPEGYIRDEIVGRVETLAPAGPGAFETAISYSPDSVGHEVLQFINVVFGNSSLQAGIKVVAVEPGPEIARRLPGPRFGVAGLRARAGRPEGGLIAPVIKPQGSSATELAAIAGRSVAGGADIIKEDHGLANQPMAPFEARVAAVADAVGEANAKHGALALYIANVTGAGGDPIAQAHRAKELGASGVLLMPGLLGFGPVAALAGDPGFDLPIMTHPAFTGGFVQSPEAGIAHGVLYGTLQRIAGADISVFPNVGGRFGFSAEECQAIAEACRDPDGFGPPILPSPGGGMSVERAPDMAAMYGPDVVYLLGGSLLRHREKIGEAVRAMREALEAAGGGR
ncbi:MAG: RuBisCO large subunit C-terminal-like domain-containing protein [Paracoccaceae bacterium]|nr:RuBisCO large subunit C-terminal-like domain-containing protein [Paracoccaceae bacterium]